MRKLNKEAVDLQVVSSYVEDGGTVGRSPRDRRLNRDFGKMYEPKFPIAAHP